MVAAPTEEDSQVGLGMDASLPTVAAQEDRYRGGHNESIGRYDTESRSRRDNDTSPCVTTADERQPTRGGMCGRLAGAKYSPGAQRREVGEGHLVGLGWDIGF